MKFRGYIWWMAWRQLVSSKRGGLSFMTIISILGVGIGVAALVIVLSVMGGFENDLKGKMFRGLPHVEILAENAMAGFSAEEVSLDKLQELFPEAIGMEPFVQADVVLKHKRHLASVTLFGIDHEAGGGLWGFADGMLESQTEAPLPVAESREVLKKSIQGQGLVLGESLAVRLSVQRGDVVTILNPQARGDVVLSGEAPVSLELPVEAIFRTDLPRYDSRYAVVNLDLGRKFMPDYDASLDEENYVTGVAMNLHNPEQVDQILSRLGELEGLKALTWKDVNKSLLFALKLEKFTMGAILLLIVLVAAFSISGTLMMSVFNRRGQVALLQSIGMGKKEIAKLYLSHGSVIGLIGTLIGLALGLLACGGLYFFQFVDLPPAVYYQKKLPVRFLPLDYLVICGSAWLLSLFAATYPAIVAARQDPGNGLRFK